MATIINGVTYYGPSEVARMFGVHPNTLQVWRLGGKIEGTQIGNIFYYTQEQINAANTEPRKRGPKPKGTKVSGEKGGGNNSGTYLGRNFAVAV